MLGLAWFSCVAQTTSVEASFHGIASRILEAEAVQHMRNIASPEV